MSKLLSKKSVKALNLKEIKQITEDLEKALITKSYDHFDIILAVNALKQSTTMYEIIEERFLKFFGAKRQSDSDELKMDSDGFSALIYFDSSEH